MKKTYILFYLFTMGLLLSWSINAQEIADSVENKTVRLLYRDKPVKYLTESVSFISASETENMPGTNRLKSVAGRVTGFSEYNVNGLPGFDDALFQIRGFHITPAGSPTILINGIMDDNRMLDPYDIESIVILKDAASTAMFGLRSTNGIILINTKKGESGGIKINFNSETSFSQPTRLPKYLDAYNYAILYNEAMLNDNPNSTPKYDAIALEAYRTGSDPYKYPNVNWMNKFLKKNYVMTRQNFNVSEGGKTAKYYISVGYLYNSGVFNVDKDVNTYNTNTDINVFTIHSNIQLNIGKYLKMSGDIRGEREKTTLPAWPSDKAYSNYADDLMTSLYSLPFNAHPIKNADASIAGSLDYTKNPYGLLNLSGYGTWERSSISTYMDASLDLSRFFLKGLSITGRAGFTTYSDWNTLRRKDFAVYKLNDDGETYATIGLNSELGNSGAYYQIRRNFDHNIGLKFIRNFGIHDIDMLLLYERQQQLNTSSNNLTAHYKGPIGSIAYRYNGTYLIDFVFAYHGSEQYPKNKRYGFFPAASLGWIASNEHFLDDVAILDFLKLRGSYGLTGAHTSRYFGYIGSFVSSSGGGYAFGVVPTNKGGYIENQVANSSLTWAKCLKLDAGLDFVVLNNKLTGSFDYFKENTFDILISNAISAMYGASVYVPAGKFENKGYEFQLGWKDKISNLSYFLSSSYTFARNKIVFNNEIFREYPWMYRTGQALDTRFGYVFDRFYTEDDDISSLPDQSLLGTQKPGDLKYKDLNNDGVINSNDQAPIGKPKAPEVVYGISAGAQYKNFDFSVMFHGTQGGTSYYNNYTYWAFYNKIGNVMEHHLGRWVPGSGQSAEYPRLTLSNTNNTQTSSYWVRDNSFVRLKYLEIGYKIPESLIGKIGMSKCRIFFNGNNLFCWDKMGIIDPELVDGGLSFPNQRTISVGVNVSFKPQK